MAKSYRISVPVVFHGFNFRPGYVWGRESSGAEFAASGWTDGAGEYYIYRRNSNGQWVGHWEESSDEYRPATEAAKVVAFIMGDD